MNYGRFILIYLLSPLISADPIIVYGDIWNPFSRSPSDAQPGYMVEIAQLAFRQMDYRVIPWQRGLLEVRLGHADCK